jgi:hypothetical protein
VKPTNDPLSVQVANQQYMHSSHTAELPIPDTSREATEMGHMDSKRKNIQSTKPDVREEDLKDFFPHQPEETTSSNNCFLIATAPRRILYFDQTRRLPKSSNSGNNYVFVSYDFDRKAILLRPIKNRTTGALSEVSLRDAGL